MGYDITAAKKEVFLKDLQNPDKLIGISGLGRMGPGIAAGFLLGTPERKLILHDIDVEKTNKAIDEIKTAIELLKKTGSYQPSRAEIASRVKIVKNLTEVTDWNNVVAWIETITESEESKKRFYQDLASVLLPSALVLTNTSSKNINKLADDYNNFSDGAGGMFLASHWSNPPLIFPFVEIAPTSKSLPGLVDLWARFIRENNWYPIKINNFKEGYILNAVQFSLLDEACKILDESEKNTPQIIDSIVSGLATEWAENGLDNLLKENSGLSLDISGRMRLRLQKTIDSLLRENVADLENISLIVRYGLSIRWKTIGILRAADLGKIDLFAEIHKLLMSIYGTEKSTQRLQKMVDNGLIGYNPSKNSTEGFYRHKEDDVKRDYDNLYKNFMFIREGIQNDHL